MPKDNTLGAPTEGLGQTVTFAAQQGSRVPQTQAAQRQALRTNASGGGAVLTARALQIPESKGDATFQVLARLGGELIKPHLEAERTAAYVQGMQKAATGQAIKEIVDEQPWYSKLFGSTSLVDGARAYTASAKANTIAAEMEAALPELRKMPPSEFNAYATQQITAANTGDSATDMLIMQQVSATLPSVMKGQAKAHLRYQQETFENSILASAEAKFGLLGTVAAQAREPGSTKESADVLGAAIGVLDILEPPAEVDRAVHDKLLAEAAIKSISGGNFDTFRLLQDSGKLAKLDPQAAYQVQRAYDQASSRAKLNVPDSLLVKVAEFQTLARQPGVTDEVILAAANEINTTYSNLTGDGGSFIGAAATVGELRQMREYRDAQQGALDRARSTAFGKEAKELAAQQAISNKAARVATGDGNSPYLLLTETDKEREEVFNHLRAAASPEVQNRVRIQQVNVAIDKVHKDQTEAAIGTALQAGDPALLHRVYVERYLPLVQGAGDNREDVAQQYVGKFGEKMAKYHSLARGMDVDAIQQGIFYNEVVSPQGKPLASGKRNDAIVSELTTGRVMSLFTTPIKDPAGYAATLAPKIKDYLQDIPSAINDAKLQMPDLHLVGGYHWRRSTQATPIDRWFAANKEVGGVAHDNLDAAFELAVDRFSSEAGIDGGAKVGQLPDTASKEPMMYVVGLGSDGNVKYKVFGASAIGQLWKSGEGRLTADDFKAMPYTSPIMTQPG